MANRSYQDMRYTLAKREITLYAAVGITGATTIALQTWKYPTLGAGTNARTYQPAPLANALPSGPGPWPLQYGAGAEGVRSVTRVGAGLWTFQLQDNYQRLVMVNAAVQTSANTGAAPFIAANIVGGTGSNAQQMSANGGSIFTVAFQTASTVVGDPSTTAGDIVLLKFDLLDGTEP